MKKVAIISTVALAFAASSFAGDWFVGAEIGHSEIKGKATTQYGSLNLDADGGHQAIKIGNYINENVRVGGSVYRFNEDDDVDVSLITVGVDYFFGHDTLRPFIGVHVGNLEYKESGAPSTYSKSSIELDSTVYGLGFGLNYKVNKNVELEGGYKFLKTDGKDTLTYIPTNTVINIESDDAKSWYFGVNYRF